MMEKQDLQPTLKILQGLAIGGEVTGAGSFVIESTQNERRGFATSLQALG